MSSSNTAVEHASLAGLRRWSLGLGFVATATLVLSFWMIFLLRAHGARDGGRAAHLLRARAAAWIAFLAFGIVALCSVGYLWLKDERLDAIAVAAAELGVVFTTIVLLTGPLWGKIAWGAWWVWDARLTLTLLLWFIYVGYFMLRGATESPERGKRFAAILGVVGAVDIPLIHMSVQWFRSQHPKPVIMRPRGPQRRAGDRADAAGVAARLHPAFLLAADGALPGEPPAGADRHDSRGCRPSRRGARFPRSFCLMRRIRIALFALAALAAPAALHAQAPAGETATEASAAPSTGARASHASPAPVSGASSLPRYTPPRTLRAYAHVFIAFAIAWALLFGYLVFLGRKFRRVEEQVAALARS